MAKLTEKDLKSQIKSRDFLPVYVIYGSEQMFVKRYTEMLAQAVTGKSPSDFNFHSYNGELDIDEFAAAVQIVPFMSDYNCVLLTDIFFDMMRADSTKRFLEIFSQCIEGTVVILSMPSYVPSTNAAFFKTLVKTAEKLGGAVCFEKQNQRTVERYIAKWANERGKLISQVNAAKLVSSYGDDLTGLKNEVEKICSYAKSEEITLDDINKLATVNLETTVYNLSNAVTEGNGQKAFNTLDQLFYQKEEPQRILSTLCYAYVDAYRIRIADECGVRKDEVAADFDYKKRSFALDRARRSMSRVSTVALRKSLDKLIEADLSFKSAAVNKRLYLEQLIAQLLLIAREGRA